MLYKITFFLLCSCIISVTHGQNVIDKDFNGFQEDGQYALVHDTSGFVNVRKDPKKQAAIVDTVGNGRILYGEWSSGEWIEVYYKKDGKSVEGYIHRSRLLFLDSYKAFKATKYSDSLIILKFDTISITIKTGYFIKGKRKFKFDGTILSLIDNKTIWGPDGGIPVNEYRVIHIKLGTQKKTIPRRFYNDVFEPNLRTAQAYIDTASGKIYLIAYNSDGGGGYNVVWTIMNGQVIDREVTDDPED